MRMSKTVEDSLLITISDSSLDAVSEYLELGIDELSKSEIVEKLPIVGSVISISKTAVAVRDWLFVKNILAFLKGLSKIDYNKRQKWIHKLDKENFRERVGAEVLGIIDRLKDNDKNTIAGKIFSIYIEEKISYDDFIRICEKLDMLFISDIRMLKNGLPNNEDEKERYRSIGLYSVGRNGVPDPEFFSKFIINTDKELVPNTDLKLLIELIREED